MDYIKIRSRRIGKMNYSRTLTLPKEWLQGQNLDWGDTLDVGITPEGYLVLIPKKVGASDGSEAVLS